MSSCRTYQTTWNYNEISPLHLFEFADGNMWVHIRNKRGRMFDGQTSKLFKEENAALREKLSHSKIVSIACAVNTLFLEIAKSDNGKRVAV